MSSVPHVQRLVARIKPHHDHPQYFEWQTGVACLFIGENDRAKAQTIADREIHRRGWERIEFVDRAVLIEERVRAEGGVVLDAYLKAQAGETFYVEEVDEIAFSMKVSPQAITVPRLTESFMDRVVSAAGGRRLDIDDGGPNRPKTADYRVGDLVLELKDLQNEGLDVRTRQEKLAALFMSKCGQDGSSPVDPTILSADERRQYFDIVGTPVRKRLTEAGRQVRSTLERLAEPTLRGGAILLNTGYGTLSPDELADIALQYTSRSTTLSVVVCISTYTLTNGLDTVANFAFHPPSGGDRGVEALREAFWREINDAMGAWARGGFRAVTETAPPLRPIVFESAGGVFSVEAPKPQSSVGSLSSDPAGADTDERNE